MNRQVITRLLLGIVIMVTSHVSSAQLVVTETNSGQALVQKLLGAGVVVSNVTLTTPRNGIIPTAIFNNLGLTNIGIDSGIVITNGRAKTNSLANQWGVDGNGITNAGFNLASGNLNLPGDADLANELGIPVNFLNDAIALEFDFIPLGDTIRFNYILSSEEYDPSYVCTFADAFGFFITGPGIPGGTKNIAIVPNTTMPVTIKNINDVPGSGCPSNTQLYIHNVTNTYFNHDGLTRVLTAVSAVQPCQTYHLKLVVADFGMNDHVFDTGVFLEAGSLSSNAIQMTNLTQTDATGNSYLVEGCATGSFNVRRPHKEPTALAVTLSYGGIAQNGIDYQLLPTTVTIPANDSFVTVNVFPIIDNIPEGIERLVVYAVGGCASGEPTDSTVIQLRDYDTLGLAPKNVNVCEKSTVQLIASSGYTVYQWDTDPTLSSTIIYNPVATPNDGTTVYYCTATEGTCHARDSTTITTKGLDFIAKQDVNCRNGTTGFIHVAAGEEWIRPVEFSINGGPWQPDSNFNNLPVGQYTIRLRDVNCIDSMIFNVVQAHPDLVFNNVAVVDASCSGDPDGTVTITPGGGNSSYTYSSDGINFQPSNIFNLNVGSYTFTIRDGNGCTVNQGRSVGLNNTVTLDAGADKDICEGTSYLIPAVSNGTTFDWTPAATLTNSTTLTPTAAPLSGVTKYYVTAKTGICTQIDSMSIRVLPAPTAFAGPDVPLCLGQSTQLNGSGGVTYQWFPSTYFTTSTAIPDPVVKPKVDMKYWLIVTDANNCKSLIADTLLITVTPTVKIFAGNDTIAAVNQPIQLHVRETGTAGVTSYTWSPANFLDNTNTDSPVATLPYDYTYVVKATTPSGCEGADEIKIKVYKGPDIYVPTAFTPNNDGLNDILKAIPVGMKEFHYFRVFNRWGQMVFTTKDPAIGWNGKINGTEQATGTYIWMAEAIDFKGNLITRKGVVTIVK